MIEIDIRSNLREVQRDLTLWATKQVPYATALALTQLAREVAEAERDSMAQAFDRPTPFTQGAMGVIPALKNKPYAKVFVKDRTAAYLDPFEGGGPHYLGQKRGILKPVGQPTNAYGNLPAGTISRLKGRKNVYIGAIETKKGGTIRGVWERVGLTAKGANKRTPGKGKMYHPEMGRLRLLIRFSDAHEVNQHWGYEERAERIIGSRATAAFDAALAKAMQ